MNRQPDYPQESSQQQSTQAAPTQQAGQYGTDRSDGLERGMQPGMDRAREAAPEMQQRAHDTMDRAGEMAEQGRERAMQAADKGEERAAEGMERAASEIRDRADGMPMSGAALKAADGMERGATYLRTHDTQEMWQGIEEYVRRHPMAGVAGSVAAGFIVGRMLR